MSRRLVILWLTAVGYACCAPAPEPLKIIRVAIRQIEDGSPVGDRTGFVPGETVYVSFEVVNFTLAKETQSVSLTWSVDATDPKGIPIIPQAKGTTKANLQPEDKDWRPRIRQSLVVPSPAPGGTYSIHLQTTDVNSAQSATADTKFTVSGPEFVPAKGLEIRSFGFYRTEDEPRPLTEPVFRPGSSMYARFQIVGYKYGEKNADEVTYGVSILGSGDKVLYTQDPAVDDKTEGFYPKPWVDATMSLSLAPGTKTGAYTLLVNAKDKVGNQSVEIRKPFRVE
jgi:hypothetical protein